MSRPACLVALAALAFALALPAPPAHAAKEKGRKTDLVWTAPDFAVYGVKSIAMLPVATYDKSLAAERAVTGLWGQNFKDAGYRWISAQTAREILRSTLGDSTLTLLADGILKDVRVDSLIAPVVCAKLRADAVLSVRVEQWEQQPILWNQSGKPTTSVQLRAALVDSTGTLLWNASGGETGEGAYHDPSTNPIAVSSSNLENTPVTGQGGPPAYDEVLNRLLLRWAPQFPKPAAPAPAK